MNTENKNYLLATCITALSLVVVLLVGCGNKEASSSEGVITDVVMSTAVDENERPLNPTTVFATDAYGFFCSFRLSGFPVGTKMRAELVYVGGEVEDEVGQNVSIDVQTGTIERKGSGYTYVVFLIPSMSDYEWPVGDYKIVLSVDDQEKASAYFKVE